MKYRQIVFVLDIRKGQKFLEGIELVLFGGGVVVGIILTDILKYRQIVFIFVIGKGQTFRT